MKQSRFDLSQHEMPTHFINILPTSHKLGKAKTDALKYSVFLNRNKCVLRTSGIEFTRVVWELKITSNHVP